MTNKTDYFIRILGQRVKSLRLKKNITQKELSIRAGVSKNTVQNAEKGECTLKTFVSILEALGQGEILENLLPEQLPSPLTFTTNGQARVRARKKQSDKSHEVDW